MTASRTAINPWSWQDQFGFAQAVAITAPRRLVFCAGQASIAALPLVIPRLETAECRPASTLLGVTRLALLEMLIEIEATALLP